MALTNKIFKEYADICISKEKIPQELFEQYGVKKGLRDKNGKGVLSGITDISKIVSSEMVDGVSKPCDGRLYYRGYDIFDLVDGVKNRGGYGFEETAYLLLFGELPNEQKLADFNQLMAASRTLPKNFVRDVIMKAPSKDIMNCMTKSILTLGSYDKKMSDVSISNVIRQSIMLISVFPMFAVYSYHAYNHAFNDESFYIHRPDPELGMAENILRMLRPDKSYTELEAKVLDIALMLHMEHGGGNNSTFTTRVVSSAGSDTYSVIAAALSSLKGPKHGGANIMVVKMIEDLKANVDNFNDEEQLYAYLEKLVDKNAFDKKGLIYGMGHAVYSISDPRARVFKQFVEKLAIAKGREEDYRLYSNIERLAPEIIGKKRKIYKGVSANVDFYSGFVYSMLNIPVELYTPLFAMARIVGWSAHRIEELINVDKIIRPAYQSIVKEQEYVPISDR
ncbi:MAG: citrate/2-methylcitrate synthase [Coprococcus sp.]|nr:citrate/2-methylcitrate synthase [Coprococcus sp.]